MNIYSGWLEAKNLKPIQNKTLISSDLIPQVPYDILVLMAEDSVENVVIDQASSTKGEQEKVATILDAEIRDVITREIDERRKRLETEFPDRVIILDEGSVLYHRSGWPSELIKANRFNPTKSNYGGAFHFTDKPTPLATNCQINTGKTLLLINSDLVRYGSDEFTKIEARGDNFYERAENYGFDGFIQKTSSMWAETKEGEAKEIVILPRGLDALEGNIRPFNLSSNSRVNFIYSCLCGTDGS